MIKKKISNKNSLNTNKSDRNIIKKLMKNWNLKKNRK